MHKESFPATCFKMSMKTCIMTGRKSGKQKGESELGEMEMTCGGYGNRQLHRNITQVMP